MYTLSLPLGTAEYVVQVVDRNPDGVDLSSLAATMAVTEEGSGDTITYNPASYFGNETGYGILVDTEDLGVGTFLVRTKVVSGVETILLGPNRLIVA